MTAHHALLRDLDSIDAHLTRVEHTAGLRPNPEPLWPFADDLPTDPAAPADHPSTTTHQKEHHP